MKKLPSESIDLILTDLPYGKTKADWDTMLPLDQLWSEYKRLIKKNHPIVLTAAQPFTSQLILSNRPWWKYNWYWIKCQGTNPMAVHKQPMSNVEEVCVFYEGQCPYYPKMREGKPYKNHRKDKNRIAEWSGDRFKTHSTINEGSRYPLREIRVNLRRKDRGIHPTQKPVELMEDLIRTYTKPGDTILESCAAKGTTGLAAQNLGRCSFFIEREEKYVQKIKERLDFDAIGKKAA